MKTRASVVLIANDLVPGLGMPVAAPGLRVHGLAHGLRAFGFDVRILVMSGPVMSIWRSDLPPPRRSGIEYVRRANLADVLRRYAPAVAILTNSNQVDALEPMPGVKYILDFFAPKVLEAICSDDVPKADLEALRARKLRAIDLADAYIVNGHKKVPYFLGWLAQAGVAVDADRLRVVEMCLPSRFSARVPRRRPKIVLAGYQHSWSRDAPGLDVLLRRAEMGDVELGAVVAEHWGAREASPRRAQGPLHASRAVETLSPMRFGAFTEFLSRADVAVDIFERNLEREYAMVTRSVVAIACGLPIVHPHFTEIGPIVDEFDAGWILDDTTGPVLDAAIDEIVANEAGRETKSENARRLWAERFSPSVAVRPLAELIDALSGEGAAEIEPMSNVPSTHAL